MNLISVNDKEYEIIKDYNDAIELEELTNKLTDYFDDYDYIVGDWSYGKLRLKGFYDLENENVNEINTISNLDEYLNNYCSYGCKHFILRKKD